MPNGSGIDTRWLSPATTWQGEDMAACRDGTEEIMSKKPEERLNILPTSFALQMSSQKNERGLPQTDFACWKRA
jgi:hypothetical protein